MIYCHEPDDVACDGCLTYEEEIDELRAQHTEELDDIKHTISNLLQAIKDTSDYTSDGEEYVLLSKIDTEIKDLKEII